MPHRLYRLELLECLTFRCFGCGVRVGSKPATMANMINACTPCADAHLNPSGVLGRQTCCRDPCRMAPLLQTSVATKLMIEFADIDGGTEGL
jgi:DNA-directed RNA polymerase subunit N (RpoN/RPB10)